MADNVACPKCGGATWDNRVGKKNPKAPDFKCRDRSCDGVIWPPKPGQGAAPAAQNVKGPYSSGPALPGEPEYGQPLPVQGQGGHTAPVTVAQPVAQGAVANANAALAANGVPVPGQVTLDSLFALYGVCFNEAFRIAKATIGNDMTHEGVSAQTSTLFIAAANAGLHRGR